MKKEYKGVQGVQGVQDKCTSMRYCLALLALLALPALLPLPTKAQDIHFSFLDLDPLLFNPAYSGFFDGQARFGAVYRNQWASVTTPFQTISVTGELSLMRSKRNKNGLSAGLWVSADRAGDLDYGSTSASAILSYYQAVGNGDNLISVAGELGIGQTGFNLARKPSTPPSAPASPGPANTPRISTPKWASRCATSTSQTSPISA